MGGERSSGPMAQGLELYVPVPVVYEVNILLAGVDMTGRVAGAFMYENMD